VAEEDGYPSALAGRIGFLLARAHLIARAQADAALDKLGLSMKAYAALATLISVGAVSQQNLSRRIGMDPATMVDVIDSLENSGFIERRRNANDRRSYALMVTAKGKSLYRRAEQTIAEAEALTLKGMKPDERRALMTLLGKIAGSSAEGAPATDELVNRALGR
jgi:DNA-binding MarR family transcriptional regulator